MKKVIAAAGLALPMLAAADGGANTGDTALVLLSAGLVIAMFPVIVAYLLGQRQLIKGLTAGAVK